jgi:hypothetical protein
MRPTETLPHGTTMTATNPGYDIHRSGVLVGRVHIRRDFTGRRWVADLIAYDGFTQHLEGRTPPATLRDTRAAARQWCERIDNHAHACSSPA